MDAPGLMGNGHALQRGRREREHLNFSHHTLTVSSPAIPTFLGVPALELVRLSGREGVNSLFEYELLLNTPESLNLGAAGAADWDLDRLIGREISCVIELDGAGRFIPGAVGAAADRLGSGTRQINALNQASFAAFIRYQITVPVWVLVGPGMGWPRSTSSIRFCNRGACH